MTEELKIIPNEGTGQVRFGMRPSEVKLIMGNNVEEYNETITYIIETRRVLLMLPFRIYNTLSDKVSLQILVRHIGENIE